MVTVDTWTLGVRPGDLERGNFPQFRGFCMENYYTDVNFTKHLAKLPPRGPIRAALAHFAKIFALPLDVGGFAVDPIPNQASCRSERYSAP